MAARRRRGGRHRLGAVAASASILLTGCFWGGGDDDQTSTVPITDVDREPNLTVAGLDADDAPPAAPLGLVLGEGAAEDAPTEPTPVVEGTPLTDAEVDAVLDRLPPWNVSDDDRTDVEFPAPTLQPPEPGTSVDAPFPPEETQPPPGDTVDGPLEVVRFQPEGEVDLAPFVTATFNQPMVPVGTVDQVADEDVPVTISPSVEGRWRWIGTRTIRFEVDPDRVDRLPAATEFEVTIPGGTSAESGARLGETVRWTFTTPTVSIVDVANDDDALTLEPVFVLVFDQLVDPGAVLDTVAMSVNGTVRPVRRATATEIDGDEEARRTVERALDGRWVAFTPVTALPADASLRVTIGPGTPSAEGPLTSPTTEDFTARTFGELEIDRAECERTPCQPGDAYIIDVNNPLDPEAFAADQVVVDPSVPGLRIDVAGSRIRLRGATEGRTDYTIRVAGALRDTFGQELGTDRVLDWRVGAADPGFAGFQRQWFTTDPAAETPTVSVQSINHDSLEVTAWAVEPVDLPAFEEYLERRFADAEAEQPEWSIVLDETVEVDSPPDQWTETTIDLSSAFEQVGSQLVVRIAPSLELTPDDDLYWRNAPTVAWVQRTTLGVDAFVDADQMLIWTTDLLTGAPVGGVQVELIGDGRVATTDDEGLATIELGPTGVTALWANAGDRTALLRSDRFDGWVGSETTDSNRWYVFDDRGIYRPGETVRLTGWVRRVIATEDGRLEQVDPQASVSYTVRDVQGTEIDEGTATVNALGGFNFAVEIPEGANLGTARVELSIEDPSGPDGGAAHTFEIQEFRRPEFEVAAEVTSPLPQLAASPATVAVTAEYFSGGPLPDAAVDWLVSTSDATYEPPNWADYSFGVWQPWWWYGDDIAIEAGVVDEAADAALEPPCVDCGPGVEYEEYSGRTDADGVHRLDIDFDHTDVDLPHTVTAEATVLDVDRQAWAARASLLVHPASVYVGLRSDRPFVARGTPIRIESVVADIDGDVVAGRPVEITAGRLDWTYDAGRWTEVVVDETECELTSSTDPGAMQCEFPTEVGGQYRITATVTDAAGDPNRSELSVWVDGAGGRPTRNVDQETATVIPDRETYRPGDVAELFVQSPIEDAHGLLTVTHGGIVVTEPFEIEGDSTLLELPIEDGWIPNVDVQVDLAGSAIRVTDDGSLRPALPTRPAFATGRARLSVPPVERALDVTATPAASDVTPGSSTSVTVAVEDADGAPVADAGVAVVVVDEAVLALTDHELADPLAAFYPDLVSELQSQYLRSAILLDSTDQFGGPPGGADGATADDAVEEDAGADLATEAEPTARTGAVQGRIDVRSDFDALAVYEPDGSTGADGTVTVDVPVPDSLTRYRIMAVAVDGAERFGTGESSFTSRLALQVRPSVPRFLNFGDRAELPVVVQNQSGEALTVDLAIQVANLSLDGPAGRRIVVPAGDRVEVRFPVLTESTGTARARLAAVSGEFTDAASLSMPVHTPATAEAFATYGVVDEGAVAQTVLAPQDVLPGFGGLEIDTSATALQALTDAVIYLVDYRYDSADGYASRIMAIAALRDVLSAFGAEGLPTTTEIEAQVIRDLNALAALQNDDGGFPSWQRGRPSRPWTSVQVTHALVLAQQAGFGVDGDDLRRALEHIAAIDDFVPLDYSERARDTVRAYALHVRALAGDPDPSASAALYESRGEELQLDAIAWLWPSIRDDALRTEIERRILNGAVETAGAATFATDYDESDFVIAQSSRKTDGIILDALITQTPESDLVPKVVAGLLGSRTDGRWSNAHENAFILLALDRYFDTFEAVTPDFVARAWLGGRYVTEQEFRGRTDVEATTLVPMDILLDPPAPPAEPEGDDPTGPNEPVEPVDAGGTRQLVVAKDGDGRLYYRLALRSAPSDLRLLPRDEGFVVDRVYESTDDATDVRRDEDGTWRIAAGATVRVRVTMVADARRTDVALVDPLPAGLEAVNSDLTASPSTPGPNDSPDGGWWWWSWFEHQNLRDDRVEAFASYLRGGAYEYTYLARATTPGQFVVPPARAEEVYAPEVFGRSATDVVVVD